MIRVYIAGPYSSDPGLNTCTAIRMADHLLQEGFAPFVPHLSCFWNAVSPKHYHEWLDYDLVWLEACDCLLRLPGESPGADKEVERAHMIGIPVFYDMKRLVEWRAKQ